jgi:hypothetical protein
MLDQMFEKILHSKKVKYEVLNKITKAVLPPHKEMMKYNENVNIFINIYSLYNSLYNPELVNLFDTLNREEKFMLASDIANMCGHYRHYFADRKKLYTTFYLYYSDQPASYQQEIFPEYKHEFYSKRFGSLESFKNLNKVFKLNLEILESIVDYFPHIYLINSKEYEPTIIPKILLKDIIKDKNTFNIFITNDVMELQYYNDGHILFPKADKSYFIDDFNFTLIDELSDAKILKKDLEFYNMIAKEFMPEIFALAGNKKYNIPSIGKLTNLKALRLLYDYIKQTKKTKQLSIAEVNKFEKIAELMSNDGKLGTNDILAFKRNYKLLNFDMIYKDIPESYKKRIKNEEIKDLIDRNALKQINERYYRNYPIYYDKLLEGEEY